MCQAHHHLDSGRRCWPPPALGIADQVCRMLVTMVQLTTQVFKVLYAEPPGETLGATDRFCPDSSLSGKIF